jgi:hypothetical protein
MASITQAAANLGWEVAGPKKNPKKLSPSSDSKKPAANGSAKGGAAVKAPKVENLAPLRINSSVYDYLQESDNDEDSETSAVKSAKNKQDNRVPSLMHHEQAKLNQSVSKTASPRAAKSTAEPMNLLASSIASNKKKPVASPSAGKNANVELENTISQVRVLYLVFLYNLIIYLSKNY